jgi:hypothetical protein
MKNNPNSPAFVRLPKNQRADQYMARLKRGANINVKED